MDSSIANSLNDSTLPHMLLKSFKEVITSVLLENYQEEKRMIDEDSSMTTKDKIQAKRESLLFYGGFVCVLSFGVYKVAPYFS